MENERRVPELRVSLIYDYANDPLTRNIPSVLLASTRLVLTAERRLSQIGFEAGQ